MSSTRELPRTPASTRVRVRSDVRSDVRAPGAAFFAGTPDDFAGRDRPSGTGSTATASARCGRCRVGRSSRTASSPRSPDTRAPRAPPARSADAARWRPSCPTHRVVGSNGIGSYGDLGVEYKRRLLALEGPLSLSDDLRDELAQIAPRAALLPARRALGAVPRLRCLAPARPASVAVHLDLGELRRPPGARSRCCATSASARRSAPTGGSAFDRATRYQLHVEVDARAHETLREAGVLSASGAPLARAAEARRRPLVLPRRLPARRAARRRLALRARATRIWRCGRAALEPPASSPSVAAREEVRMAVAERRNHAVAYAKGHEAIGDLLVVAGAVDTALRLEEQAVVSATRASANRLANADEANLVRTARAAHEQLEAIRAARRRQPAGAARRDRRAAAAPSVGVAARARAPRCGPPITKAAAHRRLRALVARAAIEPDLQLL